MPAQRNLQLLQLLSDNNLELNKKLLPYSRADTGGLWDWYTNFRYTNFDVPIFNLNSNWSVSKHNYIISVTHFGHDKGKTKNKCNRTVCVNSILIIWRQRCVIFFVEFKQFSHHQALLSISVITLVVPFFFLLKIT